MQKKLSTKFNSHLIKSLQNESVLVRWMNLEPVMQSELSQKGKNIIY